MGEVDTVLHASRDGSGRCRQRMERRVLTGFGSACQTPGDYGIFMPFNGRAAKACYMAEEFSPQSIFLRHGGDEK
jgi:hypothetical protein